MYSFAVLYGVVGVDPEDELVERHHGDRGQILPVERNAGAERGGEQVRQRDDELVRIAARTLHVEEAFAAGAARLVDDHHRLLHQAVFGHDALDDARHLVGAAAGAGRHDELDGTRRLPRGRLRVPRRLSALRRRASQQTTDGCSFRNNGHFHASLPIEFCRPRRTVAGLAGLPAPCSGVGKIPSPLVDYKVCQEASGIRSRMSNWCGAR